MANLESVDMQDLITRTQAAELRNVSRAAISDLVRRGKLMVVINIAGREFLSRRQVESYEPEKGGRPPKAKEEKGSGKGRKKRGVKK